MRSNSSFHSSSQLQLGKHREPKKSFSSYVIQEPAIGKEESAYKNKSGALSPNFSGAASPRFGLGGDCQGSKESSGDNSSDEVVPVWIEGSEEEIWKVRSKEESKEPTLKAD
jgi:hypothetical protein